MIIHCGLNDFKTVLLPYDTLLNLYPNGFKDKEQFTHFLNTFNMGVNSICLIKTDTMT